MSSLLLKWLNDDLQLSQYIECFESDFASGYLLGEILHRSNQQHNFTDFVPTETSDAKIVNFSLLEPTIRSLGIKFDAVTATNVMNQQAGVAAKLLYQIKTHFAKPDDTTTKRRTKCLPKQISIGYGVRSLSSVYAKIDVAVPDTLPASRQYSQTNDDQPSSKQPQHVDVARQKRLQRELRCDLAVKRRAKFVKQSDTRQRQRAEKLDLHSLETALLRPTTSELAVEATRRNVLTYMDVVVANREYREGKYAKRRKRDELEAITRDASAYGMIHHRYTDAVLAQNERYDRLSGAVDAATSKRHQVFCSEVLDRVLDLVHEAATYRTTSTWIAPADEFIPDTVWQEFKAFFVNATDAEFTQWHSPSFHALLDGHEYSNHVDSTRTTATASLVPTLPTPDTSVTSRGGPPFSRGPLVASQVLGEVIKYVRVITDPLPSPPKRPELPPFPLKIVLLGKPFSGRKTLSKRLCATYNLAPLSVHTLLDSAITQQTELGKRVKNLLQDGKAVPNDVYIALLHDALVALGSATPVVQGWVLEDFVCDVDEARDLERLLSGVVPGELPRTASDRASSLAPGQPDAPLPSTFFQGKSGLDMVFMLPIQRTTLYRHCLGKLIDPVTHAQFHIRSNPPPENSTMRYRLQLWSDGIIAPENLSLHAQSHDTTEAGILTWFRQYGTLRHVDSKCSDFASTICDHVDHFLTDAAAARHQADRSVELAAAMALGAEEFRTRTLATLDAAIGAAQAEDATATASLKAAEDAKAKKDELAPLKAAADTAKGALDHAVAAATMFLTKASRPTTSSVASPSVAAVEPLAEYVATLWATTERTYETVLQRCFAGFRRVRMLASSHRVQIVSSFCSFVRRVDTRQSVVDSFQADFNAVIEDMRFDVATQAELHVRTDTLQDALLSLIEAKGADTAAELGRMLLADGWKDVLTQSVVLLGQTCLQAEVDRYFASVAIIADAIQGHELGLGKPLDAVADGTPASSGDAAAAMLPPLLFTKEVHVEDEKEAKKPAKKAAVAVVEVDVAVTPEHDLAILTQKALDACKKLSAQFVKPDDKAIDLTAAPPGATATSKDAKDAKGHNVKSKGDLHHDKSGGGLPPSFKETAGSANAVRALAFELVLVQTRIQAIGALTSAALGNIQDGMVALELDLRHMLTARLERERSAVQSLVAGVRHAVEMHRALPHRLLVHTEVVDRYPPQRQEDQDTDVRLVKSARIVEAPPVPPYPIVEYLDMVYLSTTQLNALVSSLRDVTVETTGRADFVPRPVFVEVFTRLASTSSGLPPAWSLMHAPQYMEVCPLRWRKHDCQVLDGVVF
ncbi:hypothetical protein DYB25_006864 [Aphanomyces astaci]|uniref:Calponin-homology (CH) domain-containing protein n=1 Tax=Aphanomyces astaci TaxID=112090 RepID=A0A397B8A5_APHAT|nr:hypothetical protein DYB25_006864 [Aphanomyces astaci]